MASPLAIAGLLVSVKHQIGQVTPVPRIPQ